VPRIILPAQRRRPSARVLASKLDVEARRRAELALFAAASAIACLASLVALLTAG